MTSSVSSSSALNVTLSTIATSNSTVSESKKSLFQQGKELYNKDVKKSLGFFLDAVYDHFYELGVRGTSKDQLLLTTDIDFMLDKCSKMNTEQKLFFASSLRWLGHCHQNITEYNSADSLNDTRFNFLYGLAEKLLLSVLYPTAGAFTEPNKEVKTELVELYYNTNVFMYLRKHPGKYEEACKTLDKVLEMEPSMAVRVFNLRSRTMEKAGVVETADNFYRHVLLPYKTNYENNTDFVSPTRDPFLPPLYYHNYASLLIREGRLDEADKAIQVTVDYMEDKVTPNYHIYFPQFYQTLSNLRLLQGKPDEAAAALVKSAEQANRNPM